MGRRRGGGRERRKEGGREGKREGGREGRRNRRERGEEGGKEGEREGGMEGRREGRKQEGNVMKGFNPTLLLPTKNVRHSCDDVPNLFLPVLQWESRVHIWVLYARVHNDLATPDNTTLGVYDMCTALDHMQYTVDTLGL